MTDAAPTVSVSRSVGVRAVPPVMELMRVRPYQYGGRPSRAPLGRIFSLISRYIDASIRHGDWAGLESLSN